jgi:peptide/nickel transport system permease protein
VALRKRRLERRPQHLVPHGHRHPLVTSRKRILGRDHLGLRAKEEHLSGHGTDRAASRGRPGCRAPVLEGITLVATLSVVAFNLVVDLAYAVLDPRVRVA